MNSADVVPVKQGWGNLSFKGFFGPRNGVYFIQVLANGDVFLYDASQALAAHLTLRGQEFGKFASLILRNDIAIETLSLLDDIANGSSTIASDGIDKVIIASKPWR